MNGHIQKLLLLRQKRQIPTWKAGKPIKSGALDAITRESVEAGLSKSGNKLVKAAFDVMA